WSPGEHNGTFRGNNPAFVTATAALEQYWADDILAKSVRAKGAQVHTALADLSARFEGLDTRGRGLVQGLVFERPEQAEAVCRTAFERGLLAETSGPSDEVVKLLPPLTISTDELELGLGILTESVTAVCREQELRA
ncbi:aminotransferase class III-fold pyridoxal phosphate-dependent enzyme, partial [Rhodococcus sp. NPDC058505]